MTKNLGPAPAPSIPGFEILERLGEGGMGVVYKARQVAMDRFVAVKLLRDELQQEPEYIKRFFKEARLAGRLRHANIVSALDCGSTADGRSFMIMEFVEGKPLDRMIKARGGALPEPEALHVARGIAEALQYAWFHHIIHRDLKPQNVLLTREGLPKVSDFGLCRDIRDLPHLTSLGLIHCTPEYSSPEQARGDKDIDVRADLYSLGVTLYEMLTGKLPFEATDAATMIVRHAMDRPRPPRDRNPAVSDQASQLVLDLLEKAKEERPPAPAMVIERLKSIASSPRSSSSSSTARRITRAWRGTQRRSPTAAPGPSLVAAIGIALAGIILLAAWAFRGGSEPPPPQIVRTKPVAAPKPVARADATVTPEELREQNLARFLRSFESSADGSVNHWLVLGPLTNPEDRGLDSPVARQAEGNDPIPGLEFARSDGVMARWLRHESANGTLDISEAIGLRDDTPSCLALAACWIECPENKSVEIRFSATGGYEFQLDRRVLAAAPSRAKAPSEPFRQKIVLGKGWHSILVKADRVEGRLAVQLRILTPEGERLPGIRVWH